jgi:hypothetical protein
MLTITPDQREALLRCVSDTVGCIDYEEDEPIEREVLALPVAAALADDLALPDAEGRYGIHNLPRDELVPWLEHEMMISLGDGMERLAVWHTCLTLLGDLGHEIEGSIYGPMTCHCDAPECAERRRLAPCLAWIKARAKSHRGETHEELADAWWEHVDEIGGLDGW